MIIQDILKNFSRGKIFLSASGVIFSFGGCNHDPPQIRLRPAQGKLSSAELQTLKNMVLGKFREISTLTFWGRSFCSTESIPDSSTVFRAYSASSVDWRWF